MLNFFKRNPAKVERSYWDVLGPYWDAKAINIYDSVEEFLDGYRKAPPKIGVLFASHFSQSEICNGGFSQFFFNDTGVLAPEAVEAFAAIGMPRTSACVQSAVNLLPTPYPRDRGERMDCMENLGDERATELEEKLGALDDQFFELIGTENGGFDAAATAFAFSEM